MKKLIVGLLLIFLSNSGIFSQTLDFEYSNAVVGKEAVFINKSFVRKKLLLLPGI